MANLVLYFVVHLRCCGNQVDVMTFLIKDRSGKELAFVNANTEQEVMNRVGPYWPPDWIVCEPDEQAQAFLWCASSLTTFHKTKEMI